MGASISARFRLLRTIMLDSKRFWHNIIYTVLILLMCLTLWQIASYPPSISTVSSNSAGIYSLYRSNASTFTYPIQSLSPADYHQLIDLKSFQFNILNYPCNETSPMLIVMVHSSPTHFQHRTTIRSTWGRTNQHIKVLFLLGHVGNNTELQQQLYMENDEYLDLIQGSFVDAYRNMTYKHMMVFKYVIYHCPQAKYILKIDDDVFVNMPLLLNFLTEDLSPFGGERMMFCSLQKSARVIRSWRSKWRVSMKEYPARKYPPYCPGWVILYSPDVVFNLYINGQQTDYFWVDDVHVTGTLAKKIHLNHVNIDKVMLNRKDFRNKAYLRPDFNKTFLFSPPDIKNEDIIKLWNYVETHGVAQSVLKNVNL